MFQRIKTMFSTSTAGTNDISSGLSSASSSSEMSSLSPVENRPSSIGSRPTENAYFGTGLSTKSSSCSSGTSASPDPLPEGTKVGGWYVLDKLGSGGFGAVYRIVDRAIEDITDEANLDEIKSAALKVEISEDSCDKVLKLEVGILRRLQGSIHACKLLGCGYINGMPYVKMSLVGKDLLDLKHATVDNRFSTSTTIRLAMQCLSALKDMHHRGFLHRDVKPSNFAIGILPGEDKTVFVFDFGLSRSFVTPEGTLRPPRKQAGFRGTVRYASINTLKYKDLGRCDDIWSWFYMVVEFSRGFLPWRHIEKRKLNLSMKLRVPAEEFLEGCPPEMLNIHDYLKRLSFSSNPDYDYIDKQLKKVQSRRHICLNDPFDWELETLGETPSQTEIQRRAKESTAFLGKMDTASMRRGCAQRSASF